jgi:hypothetical protein
MREFDYFLVVSTEQMPTDGWIYWIPSPGQRGCRGGGGVLFFTIKQKIIRGKMRCSNLSMMINEL